MEEVKVCAAAGCTNKAHEGVFVGDFCFPCDHAMRYGNFDAPTTAKWGTAYAALKAELLEQCRLNGMGAEREASLKARVAELERERDHNASLVDEGDNLTMQESARADLLAEVLKNCDLEIHNLRAQLEAAKGQAEVAENNFKQAAALLDSYQNAEAQLTAQPDGVRPKVMAFALLMEQKLRKNDHKGGWENEDEDYLLKRLKEEAEDLAKVCDQWQWGHSPKFRVEKVGLEAADVANFAMMLADVYGCLQHAQALAALAPAPSGQPEGVRKQVMDALVSAHRFVGGGADRDDSALADKLYYAIQALAAPASPAPVCKTCGDEKYVFHELDLSKPCPDCAKEGE